MATQGTAQQLPGTGRAEPTAARTTGPRKVGPREVGPREAGRTPAALRAVVRLWRGADARGQRLEERREQVRRDFVMLDPRPW